MNAIVLHEPGHGRHALQQEGDKGNVGFGCNAVEVLMETVHVAFAIVRRHEHADQEDIGAGFTRHRHHACQVVANSGDRIPSQAVVSAELDHDHVWRVALQRARQAHDASPRRLSAHGGVDDGDVRFECLEAPGEEIYPALFGLDTVGRTDAVTEYEQRTFSVSGRRRQEAADAKQREEADD